MGADALKRFAYAAPTLAACLLCFGAFVAIVRYRRQSRGAPELAVLMVAQLVWGAGFIGELFSTSLASKIAWDDVQVLPTFVAPLGLVAFARAYTERRFERPRLAWSLLSVLPLITTIFVTTSRWHGIARPGARVLPGDPFPALVYDLTPLELVGYLYAWGLLLTSVALLLVEMRRRPRVLRRQIAVVAFGSSLPSVSGFLYFAGFSVLGQRDSVPLAFGVGAAIVAWALYRHRLFDLLPIARDRIVEDVPDPIVVLDASDRVVEANGAARRLVAHDVVGRPIGHLLPAWDSLAVTHSESSWQAEIEHDSPAGPRAYEIRAAELFDLDGQRRGCAVVLRDITDRRGEKQALELQLAEAQKLESLGRLAGGVAHDFNNLLTVILGNAALLRAASPASTGDHLGEIEHAARSAAELTRQLLVFGRRQVLERRVLDVREIVEHLRKLLCRLIGGDVGIELSLGDAPATALVDPTQIEQIVVNLAVNARDAMPAGGELRIGVDVVELDGERASAAGLPEGPCVRLTVADSGSGMTAEVRGRIFEPFFTTKPVGKGTGLGLSIVYGAAKQNEGAVSVESEVGRGTTVRLLFPLVAQGERAPDVGAGGVPRGTERVWLVEDQPQVRSFVEKTLTQLGYAVRSFASGEQLLESMEAIEGADLLLSDLVLPNIDGRELAERVQAHRPGVQVVFASGYSEEVASRHDALPESARFLSKPFTMESLARTVRAALDHEKAGGPSRCRHALVIDDDPMIRTVVEQLLETLGCKSSMHSDPGDVDAALASARGSGSPVDLVLLDVHLGGASGLDVCKRLRESGVDAPILCMSGDRVDPSASADAGFDGVLEKPVSFEALRRCVDRYAGWSHAAGGPRPDPAG